MNYTAKKDEEIGCPHCGEIIAILNEDLLSTDLFTDFFKKAEAVITPKEYCKCPACKEYIGPDKLAYAVFCYG